MLHCEYCDYFKSGESVDRGLKRRDLCRFTGRAFDLDEIKYGTEHPCRNISYREYEERLRRSQEAAPVKNTGWKILYRMKRPAAENSRPLALK